MSSEIYHDRANRLGGFYGDLKLGSRPVLLVVDFQKGFTQPRLSSLAGEVARGSFPFFLILVLAVILFTIFPNLVLWLPFE